MFVLFKVNTIVLHASLSLQETVNRLVCEYTQKQLNRVWCVRIYVTRAIYDLFEKQTEMRFNIFPPLVDLNLAHLVLYPRLSLPMQFDCRRITVNQKRILNAQGQQV